MTVFATPMVTGACDRTGPCGFHTPYGVTVFATTAGSPATLDEVAEASFHTPYGVTVFATGARSL